MKPSARLSNSKKRQVSTLVDQAVRALAAGRTSVCTQLCDKIEALQPGNADAANIRGIICAQSGDVGSAIGWLRKAINAAPKRPEFPENLGRLYSSQEMYPEAAECFAMAMQHKPHSQALRLAWCASMIKGGGAAEAMPELQAMHARQPKDTDVLMGMFSAAYHLERYDEAVARLDEVLALAPHHFEAHFQKAQLLMTQGNKADAEGELHTALELQPEHAEAWAILSDFKTFASAEDPDKRAMEALYKKSAADSPERVHLCFALAKAHEDLKEYDAAFAYYQEGNALRHRHSSYPLDAELAHMRAVTQFYTPEVLRRDSGVEDERPVFVVGMPRCGSTLVEQILVAHPEVSSRGEWNAFESTIFENGDADRPLTLEEMTAFSQEQWRKIGEGYLAKLDQGEPGRRITDKTLVNTRLIGAIHCALPHARIVHVRRNPLDNCLAIYRVNLKGSDFDFGYDLDGLARYYREYQRLMQHWREALPEGVMYELDYETLVANQEEETRKLLDACGLDWDDACLRFEKARSTVKTSSVMQVRKAMYSDSVARWKRYEKHLQPLMCLMESG